MAFMKQMREDMVASAQKAVGMTLVEGKSVTTSLTEPQRLAMLDKAEGIAIIELYIHNNLS